MSVVVPLYNHVRYIGDAVDSILAQGAIVKEIVVLDDGSSDGSIDAMERLARRDKRIRFERQAMRAPTPPSTRRSGFAPASSSPS